MTVNHRSRDTAYLRTGVLALGLLLPTLTLIPLGSLWIWQNGYLLHWALTTTTLVGAAYIAQRRLLRPVAPDVEPAPNPEHAADLSWTQIETAAWSDVLQIAEAVDIARLTSREAVVSLGTDTIRAVAKRLHPEVAEPHWQFTLPEAFAILERVSRRLGKFALESIPLSDRLTVAQALALYRWRGAIDVAEKAYDVWRLVRLLNPAAAATQELRERLSRQMLQWGRLHVTQRLASAYVTEVGRAAIDLYGGRLRAVEPPDTSSKVDKPPAKQTDRATPAEPDARASHVGPVRRILSQTAQAAGHLIRRRRKVPPPRDGAHEG